jgi:hypothetical protein
MDVRRLSLGQELHTALPVNLTSMDGDIGNREASSYKHQISKVLLHPLDNPALEELVLESFQAGGSPLSPADLWEELSPGSTEKDLFASEEGKLAVDNVEEDFFARSMNLVPKSRTRLSKSSRLDCVSDLSFAKSCPNPSKVLIRQRLQQFVTLRLRSTEPSSRLRDWTVCMARICENIAHHILIINCHLRKTKTHVLQAKWTPNSTDS